ncbi:MAG TPA: ATP-binding protein, partial [Reyranellaceae bacterium]|nr:ATP-binding protein [Reyranellaceae bacterium]
VAKAAAAHFEQVLYMVDQGLQRTERRMHEAGGRPSYARLKSAHQFPTQLKVNLALVDADANLFMSLRTPDIQPIPVRDREYVSPHFDGLVHGTYVGRPIIERRSGLWSIPLSRAARDLDGKLIGVAVAFIDAETLGQMLHGVNLATTDVLEIVNDKGSVMVRWPRAGDNAIPAGRSIVHDPAYVASDEPVSEWPLHIVVGLDRAQIAAATLPFQLFIAAGATVGAILVAFFSALLFGKTREATAQRDEIAARQAHLLAMLDSIPADIFEFDANDRLVLANETGRKSFLGSLARDGDTLEAILKRAVDIRQSNSQTRDSARWLEDNLAFFHAGGSREERDARDAWRRTYITKLPNNGRVVMRVDISELKRGKAQLRASEARYAELVNSLPDVLITIGAHGRIRYASNAATEVLGRSPAELVGARLSNFIVERDYGAFMQTLDRLRAQPDKPQTVICETVRPDGSHRFVQIGLTLRSQTATDHRDPDDTMQLTAVVRDVHEQHVLARELDQQAANLTSVFEATGASILLLDAEQRVKMANNAYLFLVGSTLDEVVGRKFEELNFGAIPAEAFAEWTSTQPGRSLKPVEFDVDVMIDENKSRVIRVTANPATDAAGQLSNIVLIGVDDTDRRQAEIRLFDSSRLANLGEMASGVAHEINQPLAIIRLAAESVSEELEMVDKSEIAPPLSDFLKQKLERIASQTERASGIIKDLRTVARKPGSDAHPFDLADAVRVGCDLLREQMRLDRVEFDVDMNMPGPHVMGEPGRIQQVVINLVNNARDALSEQVPLPQRGPIGKIEVLVDADAEGNAVLTVQDNGPGIPEKVMPRLFEPFFTTKPVGKGTGLGLSISYDIVNRMGGTMKVDNRPEGGARFRISFPQASSASLKSAA